VKKDPIIWMLKGAAMGVAEAVPGVSGGTIALITGVYERFIAALASFKPSLFQYIKNKDGAGLWLAIDGTFLLYLGLGMMISLFSTLSIMAWLLANAAPAVWSFFMGVILVSLWQLGTGRSWKILDCILLAAGATIAITLATAGGVEIEPSPSILILGGAIAISAMLLPGISGSFMLLLLGLYPVIVNAVHERELLIVFWVALGCLIGIITFSRFLQWALSKWHERVMSFMLGFVVGAVVKVWPWQREVDGYPQWLTPQQYTDLTGSPALVPLAIFTLLAGGALVWLLHTRASK
jgi:putative membrane protein